MPFLPNIDCIVTRKGNTTDLFGQTSAGEPVNTRCAIVTMDVERGKTSVRTDASGSGGRAEETTVKGRVLFPATFKPATGDKIEISGFDVAMEIVSVFPRVDISGTLDHYQVDCDVWSVG